MARIEKTIFISYRRTDVYTALAVYENLKNQGYDVFFDYRSISSGAFEQIITSNIRARAHFILILTPTALDRCNEPGDWLQREIEIAMDEKRNIVPLFFKGFRFGDPSVTDKLTGKLKSLSQYNGLNVHEDYFDEGMQRVRSQFLSIPLNTILHPVSTEVQKVVREEQVAADQALDQIEDVKELVKQAEEKSDVTKEEPNVKPKVSILAVTPIRHEESLIPRFSSNFRLIGGIAVGLLIFGFLTWGASSFLGNSPTVTVEPTGTHQTIATFTSQSSTMVTSASVQTDTLPASETSAAATPTPGIGSTMTGKDDMTLLYVPAGEFTMGSEDGQRNEQPVHRVDLDAFWIDQTEVTNKMYGLCVDAGVCKEPTDSRSYTHSRYYGNAEYDNYPVIYVDWNMAKTYCKWANRRLPTEAEWEKAASWNDKNYTKYIYPWGNSIDCFYVNYKGKDNGNSACVGDTAEVGKYTIGISPYRTLDMAGNVWEWVSSLYEPYPYRATDGREDLGTSGDRVLRSGAWNASKNLIRTTYRLSTFPSNATNPGFGFRCAMSATP